VDIEYADKKLQKICDDRRSILRKFGKQNGEKLMLRLNELKYAANLSEISILPPPRRHELENNRKGQFAVDLKHPYRLIFVPIDEITAISKPDNGFDVQKITKIKILEVTDYHGK